MNHAGRIDFHMHTVVSDGTDTPEEILKKVKAAGIGTFSVTDHDAVKAGQIILRLRTETDPRFVPGVEFSCKDEEGKYHILGYGFDPEHEAIRAVVEKGHRFRMKKVLARLEFLKTEFGFAFPEDEIERLLTMDNPGKPHIGNLMVRYGFAESKEQAIKKYLDRIRFSSEYIRPEEGIGGILHAGGIPVLAHPFYGSGDELILGEEMEKRLLRLLGCGLQGVEAFYSGFSAKLRAEMLALAVKHDLYVTAGSDYHGTNKLVGLGDTGLGDEEEAPVGLRRFLEAVAG
ncbi:MAG: PHP domain-containing protein [Eubacteriales bacterium]|nr:PHP domain-containing protein [Eubacteriales bacterium]